MTDEHLLSPEPGENELSLEKSLRPQLLAQYIGQHKVKQELSIYIEAARNREEPLDHVLLYGPSGIGENNDGYGHRKRDASQYPYDKWTRPLSDQEIWWQF